MLPTGTITLLFSDIEGSTRLLHALGDRYPRVLETQRELVRQAIAAEGGVEVDSTGDAFFAAFPRATAAVHAAAAIQRQLAEHVWPAGASIRVRMGLHTGEPAISAAGYTGMDVHGAARICAAAHGGQVLLSETTRELVRHDLTPALGLRDMGEHRLKDLNRPIRLYQLVVDGLPSDFPPIRTLNDRPHNLPTQTTSLVGRERDIAAAIELIRRQDVRLVTLTGPGGTGKTRLSLEVAANLIDEFDDGVFFVPLAPISDPSLVPSAVARAVGVRENPAVPLLEALEERLAGRQLLLLIDNFEQVASAASFVADLLRVAPRMKILVTSRTVLHLSGEHEYAVPPLDLPAPGVSGGAGALSQYAAVELFIQRAKTVRPDFSVTDANAAAVAEICFRLDGLPLAIELAAARIKLFSPDEMLSRLNKPLDLLRGGPRDVPDRHRTLQRAIAWSYDLLDADEQTLFRRLSVFAGGCRLDAAEAVCGGDPLEIDVLDGISALVDKSLIRPTEGAQGAMRFIMLETIREFGLQRLRESGEEDTMRREHASYFRDFAESAEPHLTGPDQARWFDLIEFDTDNYRQALSWAVEEGEAELGLRTGAAMWRFWIVRGLLAEGRKQLESVRSIGHPEDHSRAWIKVSNALGTMTQVMGDFPAAGAILKEVLDVSLRHGDRPGIASSMNNLSWVLFELGDMKPARDLAEQARQLCRELGDRRGEAAALTNLAMISHDESNFAEALAFMEECMAIRREMGEKRGIAYAMGMSASLRFNMGDYEEAERLTADSLALAAEIRDKQGPAYMYATRGHIRLEMNRLDEAEADFELALPLWMEMGAKYGLGYVSGGRGLLLLARGEPHRARPLLLESLRTFRQTGQKRYQGLILMNLGHVEAARGEYEEALARYDEASEVLKEIGDRRTLAGCLMGVAAVKRATRASAEGRRMLDQAYALLDEIGSRPTPLQVALGLAEERVAAATRR